MKKQFLFSVESILTESEGYIGIPMSPYFFAANMSMPYGEKCNRIAQVNFEDATTFQHYEESTLTTDEIIILACAYPADYILTLWINQNFNGLPVGIGRQSDRKVAFTSRYRKAAFERKPTKAELTQLFEYVFNHPDVLDIK